MRRAFGGVFLAQGWGIGNVTPPIVRDWVVRFNAEGPAGLRDRKAPGPKPRLTDEHRKALAARIDRAPTPAIRGVVRWRLCDLGQWLWEALRVSVSMQTLSRELRAMGYRKLSARPKHHAQAAGAIETLKKCPLHADGHRARAGPRPRRDRDPVRRRGQSGPEERHHPPLGTVRNRLSNRCSATTTTSSITAATTGTASSSNPGASCPSGCAIGRMGSEQWELV